MLCYDFREGYSEILELLNWEDIPLLVFSAGVGDVIEQCFVQRYKLHKNIHIIANWMSFSHEVCLKLIYSLVNMCLHIRGLASRKKIFIVI